MDIKKNSYYFDIHSMRVVINKKHNLKILISFYKFAKNYYDEFHMEYTYKIAFWERLCAKTGQYN
jgi:hypothetical protein